MLLISLAKTQMPHPPEAHTPQIASTVAQNSGPVILILAMLLGIQPVTTDLYLPALPMLTDSLGASVAQAQLTLTGLLLAFGVSQLVWGPLSDRFGRKPVLLAGLGLYVVASIGSALAPNMALLIIWRCVLGVAMGAGVMCARAIVRDVYAPADGARAMSKALSGLGLIAFLSVPTGAVLIQYGGWRVALFTLTLFGGASLWLIAFKYTETLQQADPNALRPLSLLRTWRGILANPTFLAFTALSVASYGGLFTYLAASSFVFIKVLGLSKIQYGLVLVTTSLAYIPGTFLCRWWIARYGVRRSVALAAVISLAGGTSMGVLALAGVHNLWALMVPFWLYMIGHGVHQSCSQSGSVGPFPKAAGAASALNGFLMMLAAFFMGHWLGNHLDGTVYPLAFGIWFWSALVAFSALTGVQKYGKSAAN
jgi:MFS transporter, DHA1 family, multidrug resistance protein